MQTALWCYIGRSYGQVAGKSSSCANAFRKNKSASAIAGGAGTKRPLDENSSMQPPPTPNAPMPNVSVPTPVTALTPMGAPSLRAAARLASIKQLVQEAGVEPALMADFLQTVGVQEVADGMRSVRIVHDM
eukprot:822685-Prymnesium_polylepis.1